MRVISADTNSNPQPAARAATATDTAPLHHVEATNPALTTKPQQLGMRGWALVVARVATPRQVPVDSLRYRKQLVEIPLYARRVCLQAVTLSNTLPIADDKPPHDTYRGAMTEITDRAQQLLAGRIDAIRKLNESQNTAAQARDAADAADRDVTSAWTEATQAGWTTTELRKLGLTQPANRRGGRPKGSRTNKRATAAAEPPESMQ